MTRHLAIADPGRFEIYCHHSSPMTYPEEIHETLQICVPLEGARYTVARQSETGRALLHHLDSRDVLVVPIGQPHGVSWRRPADIVSLQLSSAFLTEVLGVPLDKVPDSFTLRDSFISGTATQLRDILVRGEHPSLIFSEAIATIIAYRVALATLSGKRTARQESVRAFSTTQLARIEQLIDDHRDRPVTLAMLAKHSNLSMSYFLRRFQESVGVPPHEFIIRRRLAYAQKLLAESHSSITEIALEIGMSHSHFSRSFMRRFNVSPREFRRQRQS